MKRLPALLGTLREASVSDGNEPGSAEVLLITPGPGNLEDGNFYPPETVAAAVSIFEGARCFLDHPTRTEEKDRPERSVKEQAGWFSNVHVGNDGALMGKFLLGGEGADTARKTIESALRYQKQYPDKVWAGYSINADGDWHPETTDKLVPLYPQYAERLQKRDVWNVVDAFTRAMSVDLVTFPARGGKALSMSEAESALSLREASKPTTVDAPDIIADLRHKCDLVEESHKPEVIANLLSAVRAYLGEEEEEGDESKKVADTTKTTAKEGSMATEATETKEATEACEACGHMTAAATEAATESTAAESVTETFPPKKDGEDDEDEDDSAKESSAVGTMTLREAEAEIINLRKAGSLKEADKLELTQLRIEKTNRVKREAATKAVREAGVDGLLDVDKHLMPFEESQWPALISVAQQTAGPARSYGSGQINMPMPGGRQVESAIEAFTNAYEGN